MSLLTKISDLSDVFVAKLNTLFANKEAVANKTDDFTLTGSSTYPSSKGLSDGLTDAKSRANHVGTQSMATIVGLAQAITDAKKRSQHTGTQTASTISDFEATVNSLIYVLAGAPNGLAELGPDGTIISSQINSLSIIDVFPVTSEAQQLALNAQKGDVAVRSDIMKNFIHNGGSAGTMADWTPLVTPTDNVLSVNGMTGVVVLGKSDIGLGNVANLSPADMPVSTAQQAALDAIQNELDAYQLEVGQNFPNYAQEATNALNF
jgi:hypothetical protein